MKPASLPANSPRQITLAFHFRYIMPGEFLDMNEVAVLLLARVIRAVRRDLSKTGSLLLRAGHLLYTADLHRPLGPALRNSHIHTAKRRFLGGAQRQIRDYLVPLDRTFVVVVSGRVEGRQRPWSDRLRRHLRHPFLFSLEVDPDDPAQEAVYLRQNSAVGELAGGWSMAVDLEALDFEPNIFEMLDRLGISHEFSAPALRTLVEMLSTPLGQGKR